MGPKISKKTSKPWHVGIHWITLAKFSQMRTHFVLAKLATSSIRDKEGIGGLKCSVYPYYDLLM